MRGVNQIAQDRLLLDDARVVLDVGYLWHAVGERRQVRCAAGGFQVALAVELLGQGHKVDGLLPFAQRDHLCEDAPMLEQKEILRTEMFDRPIQRVVVQQNRAKNGALGVQVIRQRLLERRVNRHRKSSLEFAFSSLLYHDLRGRASGEIFMPGTNTYLFKAMAYCGWP